jgi:16S rRNA processing protein RimM
MTPFTIGRVLAARGLGGELRLQTFRSDPAYFRAKKLSLVPKSGPAATFAIQSLRSTDPKTHVVALEGLSDRTAAEAWIGAKVELSGEWFAAGQGPLESLMGALTVDDLSGEPLGRIVALAHNGAQDLVGIDRGGAEPVLLPWVEAFVRQIQAGEGGALTVRIHRIEGLLED